LSAYVFTDITLVGSSGFSPRSNALRIAGSLPPKQPNRIQNMATKKFVPFKSAGKKAGPMESKKDKAAEMAAMKKGGASKAMMAKEKKEKC